MNRSRLVPVVAGIALVVVVGLGAWWFLAAGPEQEEAAEAEPEVAAAPPLDEEEAEPAAPGVEEAEPEVAAEPEAEVAAEPGQGRWPEEAQAEPEPPAAGEELAAEPESEIVDEGEVATAPPPAEEPTNVAEAETVALDCPDGPDAAPGCALAAEALRAADGAAAPPPEVTLNQPDGVYLDQDDLIVEVALPEDLGGYLYVDVLTDAGDVYHLLPEPLAEDNQLPAGGEIRIGVTKEERSEGVRHWEVGEPFGRAYLLATVSESPLYDGLRPISEPLADYRDVLLGALGDGDAEAVQLRELEFRPRE